MVSEFVLILYFLIIYLLWLLTCVLQVLVWTYWVQVKEYRFDRLWSFFKTSDGKSKLFFYFFLLKSVSLPLGFLSKFLVPFTVPYLTILLMIIIFKSKAIGFRKPVLTKRMQIILLFSFLPLLMPLILPLNLGIILGEFLLPIGTVCGVVVTSYLTRKTKLKEKLEAVEKLRKVNPFVIAITGSYGKTTTKDFVTHFLSQKYKTQKTEKSENTFFGVVRTINNKLTNDTRYFVCEIGAYKKGEIKELAEVVKPKMAIITGIEPQHVDLFGSMNNLKDAKFEIVDSLKNEGFAIFNLSDIEVFAMHEKAKRLYPEIKTFGYKVYLKNSKEKIKDENCRIVSIVEKQSLNEVQFSVLENGKQVNNKFTVKTTGVHFIENISCAILISRILGLSWVEIEKAMSSLITPEGTMSLIKTVTGAIIINDSYNSSQKSFTAALDYLSFFKNKKKVVISSGIIELGEFSQKIHEDLGVKMSELIDKVIVTNKDNALYILNGMADKSKIKYEANLQILKKMFLKSIDDSDVILLEGRQPSAIMDVVKSL